MAARSDQKRSDGVGRLEAWVATDNNRREQLQSRLSGEGFFPSSPARPGASERWARFAPDSIELIELEYGGSMAHLRLRTPSETAAAVLPHAEGERRLGWLTELLSEHNQGEGQAASLTQSELAQRSRTTRQPVAPARRRPLVVALSGLDGAGKSSQAAALIDVLSWLGLETDVFWLPLGHSGLQRTLRRLLRRLRRLRQPSRDATAAAGDPDMSRPRRGGGEGRVGTALWATVVAVIYAVSYQRVVSRLRQRDQVIVFDRYVTDAAAQIRYFYGPNRQFRFARWLLRRLSPPADCAYLLDLEPAAALARKQDQYDLDQLSVQAELLRDQARSLGVTILDAESAQDEITARIAEDIWRALAV